MRRSRANTGLRKAWAAAVVGAMAATAVVTVTATAAPGPDPMATAQITKLFDGTGHGASAATFVNSANGFPNGDDTPTDGTVSSGDLVGYQVDVRFNAGLARTVRVTPAAGSLLTWPAASDTFCQDGQVVKATRVGEACDFTVPKGAVETISRSLTLLAGDTGGVAVADQKATITLASGTSAAYSTATARSVTIVSAPAADLTIWAAADSYNATKTASSSFIIEPKPLTYPGYSPTKGMSTNGSWSAAVDVSGFPTGTTWKVDGTTLAVTDGKVQVTGTGKVTLSYTLPGSVWPQTEPGSTVDYPVHLTVDPNSFRAMPNGVKNNGDGHQPGDGKGKDFNTLDRATGATTGRNYLNNDWAAARVSQPDDADGDFFIKSLLVPRNSSFTIFTEPNMMFGPSTWSQSAISPIAPTTQLTSVVGALTQNGTSGPGQQLIVGTTWDPTETEYDTSRAVTVVGPDGKAVNPSWYTVTWSKTLVPENAADLSGAKGWSTGPIPADALAVRVTFAPGVVPMGADEGAGRYAAHIPLRALDTDDVAKMGSAIEDTGRFALLTPGNASFTTYADYHLLRLPQPLKVAITNTTAREVLAGGSAEYRVTSAVANLYDPAVPLAPVITVDLDRCISDPVNTAADTWKMTVTPAVPGPSGKVCGDPQSTPMSLTFTLKHGASPVADFAAHSETGTFGDITYTGKVSALTNAATNTYSATNGATITVPQAPLPATADVSLLVSAAANSTAMTKADKPVAELGDPLPWTVTVLAARGASSPQTSTVVVLPRNNDGALVDALPTGSKEIYLDSSPATSAFHGTYTLASAAFDSENTTPGTTLYFTTTANPTLNPGESTWYPVTEAGQGATPALAGATALRVDVPGGTPASVANLKVTLQPTGNKVGDVYILWEGESTQVGREPIPMPWPDNITVVTSSITGNVFWDADRSSSFGPDDAGIAAVPVTLHTVDADGVINPTPTASITTDSAGNYTFTELHSGKYVVRVAQEGKIPAGVESYYKAQVAVEQTYSYLDQVRSPRPESSVIDLAADSHPDDVDFGYFAGDPQVSLDKSPATVVTNSDGTSTLTWDVTVTNTGNMTIGAGTITDRMSSTGFDVHAKLRQGQFPRVTGLAQQLVLDANKDVWQWGIMAPGYTLKKMVSGKDIVQVSQGGGSYALDSDGVLWAWGSSRPNTVGGAATTVPAPVAFPDPDVKIASVHSRGVSTHVLAIDTDGNLWSWGTNDTGQLGTGATGSRVTTPYKVGDGYASAYVAHSGVSMAIKTDGTLWMWGSNSWNMQALATGSNHPTPHQVAVPGGAVLEVAGGGGQIAARTASGWYAWGSNLRGGLGIGSSSSQVATPTLVGSGITKIGFGVASYPASVGVNASGTLYTWGANDYGQRGLGTSTTARTNSPTVLSLPGNPKVVDVAAGSECSFAIDADGGLWAWGAPVNGECGLGVVSADPLKPAKILNNAKEILAVDDRAWVLREDGTVVGFGSQTSYSDVLGVSTGSGTVAIASAVAIPLAAQAETYVEPVTVEAEGSFMNRTYKIQELPPGQTAVLTVSARVRGATAPVMVLNQAWFDSELTPITGLLPEGKATPDAPKDPGVAYDPVGIAGNPTCSADLDQGDEDSCDQVPTRIAAVTTATGSLSGLVWFDENKNGIRDTGEPLAPGAVVQLVKGTALVGETVAGADGKYKFTGLIAGTNYVVRFDALGLDAPEGKSFGYTTLNVGSAATDSDADGSGRTGNKAVTAGAETTNVDAGLVAYAAAVTITKTSALGDPVHLQVTEGGSSAPLAITVTVRNTGDEPLTNLTVTDATIAGPDLASLTCAGLTSSTVLSPNATVTCMATLPAMPGGTLHQDVAMVTANGTVTGTRVRATDDFTADVEVSSPKLVVTKAAFHAADTEFANPIPPAQEVPAGLPVVWQYTVTNTGNVTVNNVGVRDVAARNAGGTPGAETVTVSCPAKVLAPGDSMACSATGTM